MNLQVNEGETHVLMGPNGAGKSTLGYALMGNPQYKVTGGSILFHGKEQQGLSADQRAKAGMFLSFQTPQEIPGGWPPCRFCWGHPPCRGSIWCRATSLRF